MTFDLALLVPAVIAIVIGWLIAKVVGFAVAPDPFIVAVAFIGSNHDDGLHIGAGAHSLKHVEGAHHVGFKGQGRVVIRLAHQRLRRKVEDHIGAELAHGLDHAFAVADVAAHVSLEVRAKIHGGVVRGGGGHAVGKTADHCAHLGQPCRKP